MSETKSDIKITWQYHRLSIVNQYDTLVVILVIFKIKFLCNNIGICSKVLSRLAITH